MFQSFRTTLVITFILSVFALTGCDKAKETADNAADSAKEAVADTAEKAVDAAKEAASDTVDMAKEAASDTAEMAKETASDAADAAEDKVAEITNSMTTTDASTATEEAVVAAVPVADNSKGKEVYDGVCFACHAQGLAGAPKLGDKENWAPRLVQGDDVLYDHAINGYTGANGSMMPAKGGRADISDEDIKASVDYMVAESQ